MREITSHRSIDRSNNCIIVEAADEPGIGGANHFYHLRGAKGPLDHHPIPEVEIRFQNGAIEEVGANGHTNEALIAVVIDRMQGFQKGKFPCRENAIVLTHLETAMLWLQKRAMDRVKRGVEGKQEE